MCECRFTLIAVMASLEQGFYPDIGGNLTVRVDNSLYYEARNVRAEVLSAGEIQILAQDNASFVIRGLRYCPNCGQAFGREETPLQIAAEEATLG